ncbi:YD repeat-containing protein [Paraburkholderia fungorum]|uniref:YD repeat-containing protein n=2 Tax=Paraburkholderia fungorum TaxID=134537 RepID=A0A1H1A9D2_9BURK|nr:YD repeat-containing protein [Paraburkholderia fungorum]
MKRNKNFKVAISLATQLQAASVLFTIALGASADTTCFPLYAKSGATPGTPSCKLTVASNTPVGLGNYNCIDDLALIDQWCNTPPTPIDESTPDDSCPVADPVLPAKGVVALSEVDFQSGGASPIVFSRVYLSQPYDKNQTLMGSNWVSNWQRRIDLTGANASVPHIVAYRGFWQPVTFKLSGGAWVVPGNPGLTLTKSDDGFYYLKDEQRGTTEGYSDTTGMFYTETTRTGELREAYYDGPRLSEIVQRPVDSATSTAQNRLVLSFAYDTSGHIIAVVPPSGNAVHYSYDAKGNLASVTPPYGTLRQYFYEDVRFSNALTGVTDESGSRIATWNYDASGRVASVTHPDTTRNASLSYGSGTTTVTDLSGTSTYSFSTSDTLRPISITTPGGAVSRAWDTAGNLKQRTTPDGNTQYTWDSANRPIKAFATVAGVKTVTTIEYSDGSSLRPHLVATPGKVRAFVYDSNGNVTGYAERQTTDLTGEQGMQAIATGSQLVVGARYDGANRLLSATVTQDGKTVEDWTYTYDARGNIALTRDAVSGWQMKTVDRSNEDRAKTIASSSGQADITYDPRGRVTSFTYDEPAGIINGGLARKLQVDYEYGPDGGVSTRTGKVSTNGGWWQTISDAELDAWLTNWELGNDPVSPQANLTGVRSSADAYVPSLCVECYMAWKANLTGKLYSGELTEVLPQWGEKTELMLSDQSQVPYPTLMPDVAASAKRSMLYSSLFQGGSTAGGMVKCSGRESHESRCFDQYETDLDFCRLVAKPRGDRNYALCKANAFDRYQQCRGY